MTSADDVGADGVSVREAIAARTLAAINRVTESYNRKEITFPAAYLAITSIVDVTLAFCDPTSKTILHQVCKVWDGFHKEWLEAGLALAAAEGQPVGKFGDWSI